MLWDEQGRLPIKSSASGPQRGATTSATIRARPRAQLSHRPCISLAPLPDHIAQKAEVLRFGYDATQTSPTTRTSTCQWSRAMIQRPEYAGFSMPQCSAQCKRVFPGIRKRGPRMIRMVAWWAMRCSLIGTSQPVLQDLQAGPVRGLADPLRYAVSYSIINFNTIMQYYDYYNFYHLSVLVFPCFHPQS